MTRDGNVAATPRRLSFKRPTLFIEVELNDNAKDDTFLRTDEIRCEVHRWLTDNFRQLQVGQRVDISSLTCAGAIRYFRIADHSRGFSDDVYHTLTENDLDIAVYCPFQGEDEEPASTPDGDESPSFFTTMQLPHRTLSGLWDSLIYSDDMPQSVLRVLTRMMRISKTPNLNPAFVCWHNLVLLYGPPGSGKTTLAQALAQRLAIRLAHDFSATKLVEIKSHALHSRFFGESSKLVGKMFEAISAISSDESLLTVVIIDEVETLAGSRENAARANECSDAIWSTNELLQGLDKLRRRRNLLFLCTSNFKDSMDAAFVDRCGIKQYIATPSVECAYEIFRSVLNELIRNDLVTFDPTDLENDPDLYMIETADGDTRPLPPDEGSYTYVSKKAYVPELEWVKTHLFRQADATLQKLRTLSRQASGLSGRTLRRMPMLALARYTVDEPCDLSVLIPAIDRALKEEAKGSGNIVADAGDVEVGGREVVVSDGEVVDSDQFDVDSFMEGVLRSASGLPE